MVNKVKLFSLACIALALHAVRHEWVRLPRESFEWTGQQQERSSTSKPKQDLNRMLELEGLDGVLMIVGQDWGPADVTDRMERGWELRGMRASAPDLVPSFVGLLTGIFPAEIDSDFYEEDWTKGRTLYETLGINIRTGHFGMWPFKGVALRRLVQQSLETNDVEEALQGAVAFAKQCAANGEKFYINVWLPFWDAAFDARSRNAKWSKAFGVDSVSEKSETCRDIIRAGKRKPRYKSCPRQVYLVSRAQEEEAVMEAVSQLEALDRVTLIAFTSTNGPESPQVYGHAYGRTYYRGWKRSLYDGGLRVPFRYWVGMGQTRLDSATRDWDRLNATLREGSRNELVGGVDWPVTACHLLHGAKQAMSKCPSGLRGLNIADYLLGDRGSLGVRRTPLLWSWKSPVPGHCHGESPGLAYMVDKSFKYLIEPSLNQSVDSGGLLREEVYTLVTKDDSADLYEHDNQIHAQVYRTSVEESRQRVLAWFESLPARSKAKWFPHAGCKGVQTRLATQLPPLSMDEKERIQNRLKVKRPLGIILMLADDLGIGDVSLFNQNIDYKAWMRERVAFEPNTPAIDSIGRKGLVLTNFYAAASVCSPTRATLLTGRYHFHRDVAIHWQVQSSPKAQTMFGTPPYLGFANPEYNRYMSTVFREAGFVVGHFGKWHLGSNGENEVNEDTGQKMSRLVSDPKYGFDDFQVYSATIGANMTAWNLFYQDMCFASHIQHDIVERAIGFIEDRITANEKFFVNMWFQNSHAPLNLATTFNQAEQLGYPFKDNPFPDRAIGGAKHPNKNVDPHLSLQIYRALVKDHDEQVQRLLNFLERQSMMDKTLLVYLSDNGPEYPGMYHASVGSSNPFRGGKRSLLEGGLRMPFMMRWDGVLPAGRSSAIVASTIDLFPTLLSLSGVEMSESLDLDGIDLSKSLVPSESDSTEDRVLLFEFRGWAKGTDCHSSTPRFAVRSGDFKLYLEPTDPRQQRPERFQNVALYNVSNDPAETDNLFSSGQVDTSDTWVKKMRQGLKDYLSSDRYDAAFYPLAPLRSKRRKYFMSCRQRLREGVVEVGKHELP